MLSSIASFHMLIKSCREEAYKTESSKRINIFYASLVMMYSFLTGYISVLFMVFNSPFEIVYFIVALIFFFGAIFVGTMVFALWCLKNGLFQRNTELMNLLVTSIEMKDLYTKGHSRHVCDVVDLFYEQLPQARREKISRAKIHDAALLHDIGKIGIPDAILNKPGKLTEQEWAYMRRHPENGKFILEKTSFSEISDWVYYHHERFDGKGYYGVAGNDIPIEAQMISIADVFSALNTDRVYRARFPYEQCIKILEEGSGTQFDPDLISCFKKISREKLDAAYEKHTIDWGNVTFLEKAMEQGMPA